MIVEIISELSDPIHTDVKNLRASIANAANEAADIIISNFPDWEVFSLAKSGSQGADLILRNKNSGKECQVEVKNYGRIDLLKLEMSLVKRKSLKQGDPEEYSDLAQAFDFDTTPLGVGKRDVERKLQFPGHDPAQVATIMSDIDSALNLPGETIVTANPVKLIGNPAGRYIVVISAQDPNNLNDWTRVRHTRSPQSGFKRRKIWTSSKKDVEKRVRTINPGAQRLSDAVIKDLRSKGDDYLMLLENDSSGMMWILGGKDPLGIGTPFTKETIDDAIDPRFTTHGGEGDRPATIIKLNTNGTRLNLQTDNLRPEKLKARKERLEARKNKTP